MVKRKRVATTTRRDAEEGEAVVAPLAESSAHRWEDDLDAQAAEAAAELGAAAPRPLEDECYPDWGLEDELSYLMRGGTPSPMQFVKTLARADPVGETAGSVVRHVEAMQAIHRSWAALLAYKREYEARTHTLLVATSAITVSERNEALEVEGIPSRERVPMHFQMWQRMFKCAQRSCPFVVTAEVSLLRCGQWVVLIRSGRFYHSHELQNPQIAVADHNPADQLGKLRSISSSIIDELVRLDAPILNSEIQFLEHYLTKLRRYRGGPDHGVTADQVVQETNGVNGKSSRTGRQSPQQKSPRKKIAATDPFTPPRARVEPGALETVHRSQNSAKPSAINEIRKAKTTPRGKAKQGSSTANRTSPLVVHLQTPLNKFFKPVEPFQTLRIPKAPEPRKKRESRNLKRHAATQSNLASPESSGSNHNDKAEVSEVKPVSARRPSTYRGSVSPQPKVSRSTTGDGLGGQVNRRHVTTSLIEGQRTPGDNQNQSNTPKGPTTARHNASNKTDSSSPRPKTVKSPRKATRVCSPSYVKSTAEDKPSSDHNEAPADPVFRRTRDISRALRRSRPHQHRRGDSRGSAPTDTTADVLKKHSQVPPPNDTHLQQGYPVHPRADTGEPRVTKDSRPKGQVGHPKEGPQGAISAKIRAASPIQRGQDQESTNKSKVSPTTVPIGRRTRVLKVRLVSKSRAESSSSTKPVLQIPMPRINLMGKAPKSPPNKSNDDSDWEVVLVPRSQTADSEVLPQPSSKKKQRTR